jgi:site-specific DNA recombinase
MPPTRAIAYLRVSTDEQATSGVSLDAQRERCEAYARLYDLQLVDVIVDAGVSAKTLERDGLQRALAALRAGRADALLVAKLDRLTRSVVDLGRLVESYFGADASALLSVGEQVDTRTAGGRLVLNVLGSVSQWEREAIGERTSAALQHKSAAGEFVGGTPPFGYRVDRAGKLAPEPAEQATTARARALRDAGLSLRLVGRQLDAEGLRSRTGRPFLPAQLQRMLATVRRDRPELSAATPGPDDAAL